MSAGRTLVVAGSDADANEIALARAASIGRPIVVLHHRTDPHGRGETSAIWRRRARTAGGGAEIETIAGHGALSSRGVAAIARSYDAATVVVGDAAAERGRITSIVDYAPVPVLVARRSEPAAAAIVGTDLRDDRFPAIRAAGELARGAELALTIVHAVEPSPAARGRFVLGEEWQSERVDAAQRRLRRALWTTNAWGETMVLEAEPTAALREAADNVSAALIIVGTRRRRTGRRMLAGSTATAIARCAPCSVLVLPLPPCP